MNQEKFHSMLGEVSVSENRIERKERVSEDWKRIEDKFSEEKLVDQVHFSEIEDIRIQKNSIYPNIQVKIDGDWRRMFFHIGDEVEECFSRLNYRWRAWSQNNSLDR